MIINLDKVDWLFLGTVVLTIAIYYLQKNRKQLSYGLTEFSQYSVEEINYKKVVFTQIRIRYVNTGNLPLIKKDFVSDITTNFSGAKIIRAELYKTLEYSPVFAEIKTSDYSSTIHTDLLNPGDFLNALYIVSDFQNKVYISGRIIGVIRIKNFKVDDTKKLWAGLVLFLYFLGIGLGIKNTHKIIFPETFTIPLALCSAAIGLSIVNILREINKQCIVNPNGI